MSHKRSFDWGIGGFLISYQALLLLSLPFYFYFARPSGVLLGVSAALLFIVGISMTAGYHRYFSHKTYKAHPIVEWVLLFFGSMSIQSSALRWANDHRLHHAYVDTDKDPYSINKGFWYAHFLWMLHKPDPINPKLVSDLLQNPRVRFQHRFIIPLMFGSNALLWLVVGWLLNDYLGAFFIAVCLRVFALHHLTWFINSLAHTWGDKPFCQEQTAVNNLVLSFLTFGEGYHNYHHVFAKDYRNGVRWYHFDPTKWLIWTLSKLGLTKNLHKMDPLVIKKRMVTKRRELLLEKICKLTYVKQEELKREVELIADSLLEKLAKFSAMRKDFSKSKIQQELQFLQKTLEEDWKRWQRLSKAILYLKPLPVLPIS